MIDMSDDRDVAQVGASGHDCPLQAEDWVDITLEESFAQTNPHPKTAIGYRRVSSLREKKKHMATSPEIGGRQLS
jgi:hypothetical protein